jgi:hypothetical protein
MSSKIATKSMLLLFSAALTALVGFNSCQPTVLLCVVPKYDCAWDGDRRDGICLFDGKYGHFCAFPDAECASGYRWSANTYREFSEQCVDPTLAVFDLSTSRDGSVGD